MMRARSLVVAALWILAGEGCRSRRQNAAEATRTLPSGAQTPGASTSAPSAPGGAQPASPQVPRPSQNTASGPTHASPQRLQPNQVLSVDQVLTIALPQAGTLKIRGRCLDKFHARPLGPPPVTRSDWQLASDSAAIFVSGPQPAGCDSAATMTVTAALRVDTVRAAIGTPWERRYVVVR